MKDDELIRAYLLGKLDPSNQRQTEERLLSDGDFFQELLLAEDDLIDQFANGRLSSHDRDDFEQYFLAVPERKKKLDFARSLSRYVESNTLTQPTMPKPDPGPSVWTSVLALTRFNWATTVAMAVAVVLAVTCAFMLLRNRQLQNELSNLQARPTPTPSPEQKGQSGSEERLAELKQRADQLAQELKQTQEERDRLQQDLARAEVPRQQPAKKSIDSPLLAFGIARGPGALQTISVPAGTGLVRPWLDLSTSGYKLYRAELIVDGLG